MDRLLNIGKVIPDRVKEEVFGVSAAPAARLDEGYKRKWNDGVVRPSI